jgi:dihydroflavonol-4-reductase
MIGGAITRALLERGGRVRAFVRRREGPAAQLEALGAQIVLGDVTDSASTAAAVDGCSEVYHCAALVDPFHWNLDDFDRVNVGGTRNVLYAARASVVRRFLQVSSIAALGAEPGAHADEFTTPHGRWRPGYGRSKFKSEELVRVAAGDMYAVSVNPAVVFGSGDRYFVQLIRAFMHGRLPAIAFARRPMPLVYVDDVVRGSLLAMEHGESGERYVLAQPTVTVGEFFVELAGVLDRRPPRLILPDWLAIAGAAAWALVSLARRRRLPVSGYRALRIGPPDYDGGRATRELGLQYTAFNDALSATVAALTTGD